MLVENSLVCVSLLIIFGPFENVAGSTSLPIGCWVKPASLETCSG
jgi:hypothetical protein